MRFLIFFELIKTVMGINSFAGIFLKKITDVVFFIKRHARSVVPFSRICAFVFARVHNAGSPGVG